MYALETTKVINNDTKFKMKSWMFELTGDWNVFLFEDESLIKAYKATIDEYEKTKDHLHIPSPPFDLEKIWN